MKKVTWLIAGVGVILGIFFTSTPSLAQSCHIGNDGQCVLESSTDSSEGATSDEPSDGPSAGSPASPESIEALAERMLALVNSERAEANLPGLVVQPWAESIAAEHSIRMAAAKSIWHNEDYFANGRKAMGSNFLGENVGTGVSVEGAHRSLMESPPHRQNILDSRFNHLGIGIARGEDEMIYVTQGFARIAPAGSAGAPSPPSNPDAPSDSPAKSVSEGAVTVSVVIDGTQAPVLPIAAPVSQAPDRLVLSANSTDPKLNLIAVAMWLFVGALMLVRRSHVYFRDLTSLRARAAALLSILSNE